MHRNYRRNLERQRGWPYDRGSRKWAQRDFWGCRRARERYLIHHERYDELPTKHYHSVKWDEW